MLKLWRIGARHGESADFRLRGRFNALRSQYEANRDERAKFRAVGREVYVDTEKAKVGTRA